MLSPLSSSYNHISHTAMPREDKYAEQKPTSSESQDSDYVPLTPRPSSSHIPDVCFPGSNSSIHNIPLNDQLPNLQSSEPKSTQDNLPQAQVNGVHSGVIYHNNPSQTINIMPPATSFETSPTSPISNTDSFNSRSAHYDNRHQVHHHHYNCGSRPPRQFHDVESTIDEEVGVPDRSRNQEEHESRRRETSPPSSYCAGCDTDVPTASTTKLAILTSHLSIQTPTALTRNSPRKPAEALGPSSTSSNSVYEESGYASISNTRTPHVHERAAVYATSPAPGALGLRGESLPDTEPNVLAGLEASNKVKKSGQAPRILTDSTNGKFKYSVKSFRTSIISGIDRSIASLAPRSKPPTVPATLRIVEKVPVVRRLPGEKKAFPKEIETYMHAKLDPSPGHLPFHPLWDPNMSHRRSLPDDLLDEVYSVNVYDVGYFDVAGRFILLFNLQKTKAENERLLNFTFKTTSGLFLPLTGINGARGVEFHSREKYKTFEEKSKIQRDLELSKYNSKSSMHEYQYTFHVRSKIETGSAIALMGPLIHFEDAEVVFTHRHYFATQSIEWYRHAKREHRYHIENGDLVFITECYKAPSWGYLSYYGKRTTEETRAYFHHGLGGKGLYGWKYSSKLPGLKSFHRQSKEGDPTAGPPDQCIGIRAYSIHCDPKAWKSMCRELEEESILCPEQITPLNGSVISN